MSVSQNYYALLKVDPSADLDTIKRAYRKQIRQYHPDQFASQLSHAKETASPSAVRTLERKIQRVQQMTQRINEAYAILSDERQRAAYDQYLSDERQRKYQAEIRRQRVQHWEGERRTVKARPHHQNPNFNPRPPREGVPWLIFAGLIGLLILVSAMFSNAVTQNHTPFTTYVPKNPTSEGSLLALDLQATTNAEQATMVARATIVFEPTATPRSSSANERLGDRLMTFNQVEQAILAYDEAIIANADNATLYYKRALAYQGLFDEDESLQTAEAILSNYSQAIALDTAFADAYLERGLLYYALWLAHDDYAAEARADLEQYQALTDDNQATISEILDELP